MKSYFQPRAHALLALVVWAAFVSWIGYLYIMQPTVLPVASRAQNAAIPPALQRSINIALTSRDNLEQWQRVERMSGLQLASVEGLLPVPSLANAQRSLPSNHLTAEDREPVLSLVILDARKSSALIDGVLVRKGEHIKGGATLEEVHADHVLLRDGLNLTRTIRLKNGFKRHEEEADMKRPLTATHP